MRRNYSKRRNSKKLFFIATVLVAAVFGTTSYFLKHSSKDEVIAKVNNQKIFKSEVERKLNEVLSGQNQGAEKHSVESLSEEILTVLAKEIYLEKELDKQAKKSKAANTQEIKEKIADIQKRVTRQAYLESLIGAEVTDEKINNKYLELSKELDGKKEYLISHIVVKTEEEAQKIVKELNGKKVPANKFADLAKKYSIDQESAAKGGSLDYILEDNLIKEIAEAVPSLKKNEVSKPIQTKFGWHLIKIGDVRDAKALSFELVKDNIRDQLTQDQINKINSQITKDVKVKILAKFGDKANEENAKPAENNAIPENVKPAEVAPASDPSAYEDESAAPAEAVETPELEQATPEAETKSDQTSETTKKIDKKSDEKHKKHKKH